MKQEQLQLTGGGDQSKRRKLDYYPTPDNVTHALMKFLNTECSWFFDGKLSIWEPACGEGAMSQVIKQYGHSVISTDIKTDYGVEIDFLYADLGWEWNADAIITNPPFNLSQQFINIALQKARIVCMLLKSQYWHAKSRYYLFTTNPPQFVLPLTWRPDFLEHTRKSGDKSAAPTMEVAWSVWIKDTHKETRYIPLLKP